jgi:hypothetical protein
MITFYFVIVIQKENCYDICFDDFMIFSSKEVVDDEIKKRRKKKASSYQWWLGFLFLLECRTSHSRTGITSYYFYYFYYDVFFTCNKKQRENARLNSKEANGPKHAACGDSLSRYRVINRVVSTA